jgi:hypothetical protein
MVAVHFLYYNFGRIQKTLRVTPAMAAGLSDHLWNLEEIALLANQTANLVKIRRVILVLVQVVMSFVAADYAVQAGIPYVGFAPLPWWQAAFRCPWSLALRLVGNTHPLAIMLILFAVYSGMAFLILRFLIVKPFLNGRPN